MAIVEVIKYNGSPDVFAWKYPSEDLGTWTQLIVNESQEVVLVKGGKALDVFQSGRHTLTTANIPLLNKIINLPFGGRSPFTAEVWYINKVSSMDIKWGTQSPIQLQDPRYKVFVPVRGYGQFGIRIENGKQFLVKLVGTLSVFDRANILKYFRGLYLTRVKDAISSYLVHKQVSVLEVNAYLDELSDYLQEKMEPVFEEYGIKLLNFYVNDVSVPEDDTAVMKLKDALAKKAEMDIIGYNYQQERSFDTLKDVAQNTGNSSNGGGLVGTGMELGLGVAMAGAVGRQFGNIMKNTLNPDANATSNENPVSGMNGNANGNAGGNPDPNSETAAHSGTNGNPNAEEGRKCPHCQTIMPAGNLKFCPECGTPLERKCPKCGTPVIENAKFCSECGSRLE